jgi:hypothetical protein
MADGEAGTLSLLVQPGAETEALSDPPNPEPITKTWK